MKLMRVLSCCLATAPVFGHADAIPTLSSLLSTAGVTANGHVSASWMHSDGVNTYHVFDADHDGFQLNQAALTVSYLPLDALGASIEIMAGHDVGALPTSSQGNPSGNQIAATQAYVQYTMQSATIMAGKFWTLAGAEMTPDTDNSNITRSFLFFLAEPASHTGIRTQIAINDRVDVILGVNNGWNVSSHTTGSSATAEAGFTVRPSPRLSFAVQTYAGKDPAYDAQRRLINVLATYRATQSLTVIVSHDNATQADMAGPGTPTGRWHGVSLYLNQAFNERWRSSLRLERFSDPQGVASGTPQVLKEATLTVAYAPDEHMETRVELRRDHSSERTLLTTRGVPRDTQTELIAQAVYKF